MAVVLYPGCGSGSDPKVEEKNLSRFDHQEKLDRLIKKSILMILILIIAFLWSVSFFFSHFGIEKVPFPVRTSL